jgi:hypothetical protein
VLHLQVLFLGFFFAGVGATTRKRAHGDAQAGPSGRTTLNGSAKKASNRSSAVERHLHDSPDGRDPLLADDEMSKRSRLAGDDIDDDYYEHYIY